MEAHRRLTYLHQISKLIKDGTVENNRVISFYGHLSREISLKNQISSFGWDPLKRDRCSCCFALISGIGDSTPEDQNRNSCSKFRIKRKFLVTRCACCGKLKKYKIREAIKTRYERQLRGNTNLSAKIEQLKHAKTSEAICHQDEEKKTN